MRAIRTRIGMSEMDFALLLGVTVRAVQLWESGAVVPSRLTSMMIRAASAKHVQRRDEHSLGTRRSRVARPRPARRRRIGSRV